MELHKAWHTELLETWFKTISNDFTQTRNQVAQRLKSIDFCLFVFLLFLFFAVIIYVSTLPLQQRHNGHRDVFKTVVNKGWADFLCQVMQCFDCTSLNLRSVVLSHDEQDPRNQLFFEVFFQFRRISLYTWNALFVRRNHVVIF